MNIPAYYLPLFYACVLIGFMAAMLEPMKPVYHWVELP